MSVAVLAPISLAELTEGAALLTRVDRKYALTTDEAADLLRRLDPRSRVLTIDGRRTFRYESGYFDTDDLLTYRQSAHGRRRRFKVRTRRYLDSGGAFLEVKVRGGRGVTTKERTPIAAGDHPGPPDRDFVARTLAGHGLDPAPAGALGPTLTTRYRRTTLVPPEPGVRLTVDTDLGWSDVGGGLTVADLAAPDLAVPDLVVVETKAGPHPCAVDRLLWEAGHRPVALSKYATGLAVLRGLPANRWARVLRRHVPRETRCPA